MKLLDIYNREVSIEVSYRSYPPKDTHRSKRQESVLEIVRLFFPRDVIIEEFTIPSSRMSLDFFIPNRRIAIEVQGEQHSEYIPFYHGDRKYSKAYANQKTRDSKKALWCENNHIKLIEIFPKETEEEILEKLK